MEHYLTQLFDDLELIITNKQKLDQIKTISCDDDEDMDFTDFSDVETYLYGEQIPIETITEIPQRILPPPLKLTDEQKAKLSIKLEELLMEFCFALDFPNNYPDHLRYPFIYKLWKDKQAPIKSGCIHIEFCDYDRENCPFPEYCNLYSTNDDDNKKTS